MQDRSRARRWRGRTTFSRTEIFRPNLCPCRRLARLARRITMRFCSCKNFNHKGIKTPSFEIFLCAFAPCWFNHFMFSHIVVFWTDPSQPNAADELIAGANQYLKAIPGVLHFHAGKMSPSPRAVVDQSYQVALNLIFTSKAAEQSYQLHPRHIEFVEKVFKPVCKKAVIYDFE